jgi:hypothetical protein
MMSLNNINECLNNDISNINKFRSLLQQYKSNANDKATIINEIKDSFNPAINDHLKCYQDYYVPAIKSTTQNVENEVKQYDESILKLKSDVTSLGLNPNDPYDNQLLGLIKEYNKLSVIEHDEL